MCFLRFKMSAAKSSYSVLKARLGDSDDFVCLLINIEQVYHVTSKYFIRFLDNEMKVGTRHHHWLEICMTLKKCFWCWLRLNRIWTFKIVVYFWYTTINMVSTLWLKLLLHGSRLQNENYRIWPKWIKVCMTYYL